MNLEYYTCHRCKGRFHDPTPVEDLLAEMMQVTPPIVEDDELLRLCDDCYKVVMADLRAQGVIA
jgi:hypothetical protein